MMETIDIAYLRARILSGACDLHMHTTASDGSSSPELLANEVVAAGLETIALTDHDTLKGIEPLRRSLLGIYALRGIEVPALIPGIELSVDWRGREVHLLGYLPPKNYGDPTLSR